MTEKACLKEVSMEGTQSQRLFIGFLLLHTEDRFRALSYKDSTTPLSLRPYAFRYLGKERLLATNNLVFHFDCQTRTTLCLHEKMFNTFYEEK